MNSSKNQHQIKRITVWGMFVNVLLMLLKIIVGSLVHSIALVADGIHTLSDLGTDFIVLIGANFAHRPADESHPYGHGKVETLAAQIIGIVLLAAGIGIAWSSGRALYIQQPNYPGIWLSIIAIISVVLKEVMFQRTRKIARITQSSSLYANAWHHRSDALSSVAVLFGGIAGLLGFGYGDQIAGLVVAFMIMGVAGKIMVQNLMELVEHSADSESIHIIEEVLNQYQDIEHWHELRTRKIGPELFLDVHILVEPTLSVLESHKITEKIERAIQANLSRPVNILVHVEPHIDEMH